MRDIRKLSDQPVSRRNVAIGTAFAVPVIMGVGAAPAMAISLGFTINAPAQYINIANAAAFTLSGTGVTGKTVTIAITGRSSVTTGPVDASGNWTISVNLTAPGVPQGTVTFTPVSTGYTFSPSTRTATKDTIAPLLTAEITKDNGQNRTMEGTVSSGDTVALSPARGSVTYNRGVTPQTWSTGQYKPGTAVAVVVTGATDAAGNTAQVTVSNA